MADEPTFQDLMDRLRSGDDEAAAELVRRYEPTLRRVARIRLVDTRLQRLFDSMDICQSVFGSFFVRAALGQYELETPGQVLRLLLSMTRKKLTDHVRQEAAARRDYRRVRPQDVGTAGVPDAGPGPYRQLAAREVLQAFRERLAPDERWLADQRAQGMDWNRIAAEQGGSAEALRKQLARAITRVAGELGLDGYADA
jgi:RNA polymerase sigma factor (sigma-70 family)